MSARRPAVLLLCLVACLLASPAAALAQGNPFTPLPPAQTDTPTTDTTATVATDTKDQGLSRGTEIAIFVGGIALVIGIGWFIMRDAKATAPAEEDELVRRDERQAAAAAHRKKQNRRKGKAQRQARKRNR